MMVEEDISEAASEIDQEATRICVITIDDMAIEPLDSSFRSPESSLLAGDSFVLMMTSIIETGVI